MLNFYRKYLLPGLIFQSVTIGGGYGTGRELVEFFLSEGSVGGYLGMVVSTIVWGVVMALTFELARIFKAYNYRDFLSSLLGKGWWGYEVLYLVTVIITVSVMGSAASELMLDMFGIPKFIGSLITLLLTAIFLLYGSKLIEKALSFWSIALYLAYFTLIITVWSEYSEVIIDSVNAEQGESAWLIGGMWYAGYNIGSIPALLFATVYIQTRKEALISGVLAGFIGILPAVLFFTVMLAFYPAVIEETVPSTYILSVLDKPVLKWGFQLILLGTFLETGIGFIHGYNERLAGVYKEKGRIMPKKDRLIVGVIILVFALFLANALGLVNLIAQGYGTVTWGFWIIFIVPVLTIGVYKIVKFKE